MVCALRQTEGRPMTPEPDLVAPCDGQPVSSAAALPPDLLLRIQEWTLDGSVDETYPDEPPELADLRRWLGSLPVIEQAKGILMAHYLIDADTAFQVLRRWSSHHNIKIRAISQQLAAAAARPGRSPEEHSALAYTLAILEGSEIPPE